MMRKLVSVCGIWSIIAGCMMLVIVSVGCQTAPGMWENPTNETQQNEPATIQTGGAGMEQPRIESPGPIEQGSRQFSQYANAHLVPAANAADTVTGGLSGTIAYGVVTVSSALANVLQHVRINRYRYAIRAINTENERGVTSLVKDREASKILAREVGEIA